MKRPRIELTVDELVLVGVDPRDARRIGEAVERAAREALAAVPAGELTGARGAIERFDGGRFSIGSRRDTAGYGAGIAAAITRSTAARKV